MLQRLLPGSVILVAVACTVFSQGVMAQETETGSRGNPKQPATERADNTADAGTDTVSATMSQHPVDRPDALEEVVVTATRVEGGGNRRRTIAGRKALDKSDQTDMEGFFDDIDGLSTLGGDGEGNSFSINGLSPDLGMVTLNGQSFGQGRGNGGMGAGDLPPDMILRVDMYKIPGASMEEGGSVGLVNLQLRNPLDLARPSSSIRGRLGYVPDKGDFNPSANFFTGRPLENSKFGYMLSLNLDDRTRQYGSQIITSWKPQGFDGTSAFIPSQVRSDAVEIDESRILAGVVAGFRPNPSLDISGKLFLSQQRKDTDSDSLQHRLEKQRIIIPGAFDDRIVSELDSSDPSRRNLRISGSIREEQIESQMLGADFVWRPKRWRVEGALGYSIDENENHEPSQSAIFEVNNPFGYVADKDGSLMMSYGDGFPPTPAFVLGRFNLSERNTRNTNGFGSIDVNRQLGSGFFRRFRIGGKIREMTRSRRSSTGRVSLDEDLTLAEFFSGQYRQTPWDTVEWPGADMDKVGDKVEESQVSWTDNPFNEYDIEQRTDAAYLQADFRASLDNNRFMVGNVGVRLVDTETSIAGFQNQGEGLEPFFQVNRYTDILPSISARMRVAERTGLTLGAARVMTHPSFNNLAPGIRINNADKTAKSGNPDLEPFRADQYLAELTWAPVRGRRLSGMLTYRDAESFFVMGEESVEINGSTFIVMRPINGYDGSILSASIKLDQNLRRVTRHLRNFALSISYTYNDSSTKLRDPFTGEILPMPNTAEHVARASLDYDTDRFSGRLMYQWRGRSLKSSFSEGGLSVWNQPLGSLNLNVGWRLYETLQLYFDARNLLSEDQVQTTDDSGQLLRITERDRSFSVTLRARW